MKDSDLLRYYDSEMRYLKEAAHEFAEQFPALGHQLGMYRDSTKRDDDVERLFQGFAFIMAKMRQKTDDDIPELTEPLLSHLLPVVNRTLPSTAVVELEPIAPETHMQAQTVPAGTGLLSLPVNARMDKEGIRCPYRTVNDLVVHPFTLAHVTRHTPPEGGQLLTLHFTVVPQKAPRTLQLEDIPLYLSGDRVLQSQLYLTLTQQITQVRLRHAGDTTLRPFAATFTPRWQDARHTALWPESDSPAMCGEIRPLLEYFTAPARYFFLTLNCPEAIQLPPDAGYAELVLTLSEPLSFDIPLPEDALRMHCVPLINLFSVTGEPLQTEPPLLDYRLRPHRLSDGHTEIYSVDEVEQRDDENGTRDIYTPYRHFRHRLGLLQDKKAWPDRYYHTRVWRGPGGMHETLLMLGGQGHEQLPSVRLLLELTCTSGAFPRMALQHNVFDSLYTVDDLTLRGKTRSIPEMPSYPPTVPLYQWHLMALLHPRALSQIICDAESLQAALSLFDWTGDNDNPRRLSGIRDVSHTQGFNVPEQWHGVHIRISLDETRFSSTGDAYLFCELLEQFFTQYASIARFTQLTVTLSGSGTQWVWPERRIDRVLM
ncbi:type VI secretion system baseplate subunit TssF [Enterobacter asburiae]|uniref:type VI secretion system baseplate subunit TssF n=1 Tax=Enterobacter asburiae TaxID=61645 RepID=UPI003F548BC6